MTVNVQRRITVCLTVFLFSWHTELVFLSAEEIVLYPAVLVSGRLVKSAVAGPGFEPHLAFGPVSEQMSVGWLAVLELVSADEAAPQLQQFAEQSDQ